MIFAYPLNVRFKLLALAPRLIITDANNQTVAFVSQKVLALREDITVFSDESKTRELFKINTDRMIDFSATYRFTETATSRAIGAVSSKGWRSIWKATYEVTDAAGTITYTIAEDNPWIKILDTLIGEIPFVGAFSGYFLNPKYSASDLTGRPVMTLTKRPAFFESLFQIDAVAQDLSSEDEQRIILSFMLMIQFMRRRG